MRVKIILPNFLAVLILGGGSFLFLQYNLENKAEDTLRSRVSTTAGLFARSEALREYELLSDVRRAAMSKDFVRAFEPVDLPADAAAELTEKEKTAAVRQERFKRRTAAIELLIEKMKDSRPDLVVVTDRRGIAVTRNVTPNACPTGSPLSNGMPVVARALDGEAAFSIWSVDDSPFRAENPDPKYCQLMNAGLLELAAAPIWLGEDIVGSLVVGFELSNGNAKKYSELLGMDVALVNAGAVYSSSFETDTARSSLEQQLQLPAVAAKISRAAASGTRSPLFKLSVEGAPFIATAVPSVNGDPKSPTVTLLMGSMIDARAGFSAIRSILVFTAVCLLIIFATGMILTRHFLRPVMEIEEGVLKVINGDSSYRFDIKSSEFGGLGYRVNQMIGALTGEDEDSSDEA